MLIPLRTILRHALVAGCWVTGAALFAQDVTVCPLTWLGPQPAPPQLPEIKDLGQVRYPESMRDVDQPGYVLLRHDFDNPGMMNAIVPLASHRAFQRVFADRRPWWRVTPPVRDGKPAAGHMIVPVIFNPKSAAPNTPNASPRLLLVTRVLLDEPNADSEDGSVCTTTIHLDENGSVTRCEPAAWLDEKNAALLTEAIRQWRFAPARQDGRPVAGKLQIPVRFERLQPGEKHDGLIYTDYQPPRVTKRAEPEFPRFLRIWVTEGMVRIEVNIDATGKLTGAFIRSSDNPLLDDVFLDLVRRYTYAPAVRDGQPVAASFATTLSMRGDIQGPRPRMPRMFSVSEKVDQSKLPPELRYDTPPEVRNLQLPVYPYALRRDGIPGMARAVFRIDKTGRVTAVTITKADHAECGLALAAALECARFKPASKDGNPVPHDLAYEQHFPLPDLLDGRSEELLRIEKERPERIAKVSALDQPVKPTAQRPPVFPHGLPANVTEGRAVIECLVDEDGRARLPRIKSATEEAFGYAAAQAVNGWWFERPTAGGKPVIVRVEVPVRFNRPGVAAQTP